MFVSRIELTNWRNFQSLDLKLEERNFIVGANASGKSNLLDVFRFLKDIVKPGGGLQYALQQRGGIKKIRYLNARRNTNIEIKIDICENLSDRENPKYKYILGIKNEQSGKKRMLISKETVYKIGNIILDRPNKTDESDSEQLTQTHLQHTFTNSDFREISDFFNNITYFNLVPQLIRYPEQFIGSISRDEDIFGYYFVDKISKTPLNTRKSRLKKIEDTLVKAVPQFSNLTLNEEGNIPHLEVRFKNWGEGEGARQLEDQFSDGTLRLIGLLWSILERNSVILIEEPGQSLHPEIIKKIPVLIHKIIQSKKDKNQLIISTHSPYLLDEPGILPEEIVILYPEKEGTRGVKVSETQSVKILLEKGVLPSEVLQAETKPELSEDLYSVDF